MNRLLYAAFFGCMLVMSACIMSACTGESTPSDTDMIEDALGRPVAVGDSIRRVVSLAPSVTEIIAAAGGMDRLVGVTTADNYPPDVASIRRISALPVDFEAIVDVNPDLVLATTQINNPESSRTLDALGIPTFFLQNRSVDQILEAILTVGDLLNTQTAAADTVGSLQARIDALRRLTADISSPPTVIVLISTRTPYSFGPESYVHDLIDWAGGRSLTADFPTEAPVLSEEYVLDAAPDVIIGPFGDDFSVEDLLEQHPVWRSVPAIQNRRVYSVSADPLLRAGPRVVQSAWEIAQLLHPQLLPNP